jgi:hypothetical protein
MSVVAMDFETYYAEDYSVEDLGAWAYAQHPKFEAYCVSLVWGTVGQEWVGHPSQAPWHVLKGRTAIAHNVLFEISVVARLLQEGVIPQDCQPEAWRDTADLAAYFCLARRRRLEDVMKAFHVQVSKDPRSRAKGVTGAEFMADAAKWQEICLYCLDDSRHCFTIWSSLGHAWPEQEQKVAELTKLAYLYGLQVDIPATREARTVLQAKVKECKGSMPWVREGRAPLSLDAFRETCEAHGLTLPASTAKDDEEFQEFLLEYREEYPWIAAMGDLRKANRLDKVLEKTVLRTEAAGIANIGLKYFGAHSGRWSGDEVNLQNLNKEPVFGTNLRNIVLARKGHVFVIYDFNQIEPRTLLWLVGDQKFLALVRSGVHPYESHARMALGWKGGKLKEEDKKLYAVAKQCFIAPGYGQGAKRLAEVLWAEKVDIGVDRKADREAAKAAYFAYASDKINAYRTTYPRVPEHWRELESDMRRNVGSSVYEMALVSGRPFYYYRPRVVKVPHPETGRLREELRVSFYATEHESHRIWGGTLTENETQAVCRDIVAEALLRVHADTGAFPLFTSHDEVVYEVPEKEAQDWYDYLGQELVQSPKWADGLPLAVEGMISPCYTK